MRINPTDIRLTPEHQAAIAFHAEQEGRDWTELIEERFPVVHELNEQELQDSLAMCDRGMDEINSGQGMTIEDAMSRTLEGLRNDKE